MKTFLLYRSLQPRMLTMQVSESSNKNKTTGRESQDVCKLAREEEAILFTAHPGCELGKSCDKFQTVFSSISRGRTGTKAEAVTLLYLSKNELENGPSGDSTDKGPSDTLQNEVSLCISAQFQPTVTGALLGRSSPTPEQSLSSPHHGGAYLCKPAASGVQNTSSQDATGRDNTECRCGAEE